MKAVIQRVLSASVFVDSEKISSICRGLLILLGVEKDDDPTDLDYLVKKTVVLRIFKDGDDNMNLSIQDIGGEVLVVSQFTLCADINNGRRPNFINAAPTKMADRMYQQYCKNLSSKGVPVQTGQFGAMMDVELVNDGPVTIILDSNDR